MKSCFNWVRWTTLPTVARANGSGQWLPLPIPENFLRHMGGISTARASRVRSYELQNRPLPEEGSIYNPTDDQLLCRFVESLPRIPSQGLFQCRSAGDNIMVTPKMIHKRLITTSMTLCSDCSTMRNGN